MSTIAPGALATGPGAAVRVLKRAVPPQHEHLDINEQTVPIQHSAWLTATLSSVKCIASQQHSILSYSFHGCTHALQQHSNLACSRPDPQRKVKCCEQRGTDAEQNKFLRTVARLISACRQRHASKMEGVEGVGTSSSLARKLVMPPKTWARCDGSAAAAPRPVLVKVSTTSMGLAGEALRLARGGSHGVPAQPHHLANPLSLLPNPPSPFPSSHLTSTHGSEAQSGPSACAPHPAAACTHAPVRPRMTPRALSSQ